MSVEYIIILCFCCFGLGVGLGLLIPFLFCSLYKRMNNSFGFDIFEDDE